MRVDYLTYFLDFCKTESISKTAAHFYMTPQGVSRALHQLEDELDVVLFVRDGSSIIITQAGRELEKSASIIVEEHDKTCLSLRKYSRSMKYEESEDRVCLISTPCASMYMLDLLQLHNRASFPFPLRLREASLYHIMSRVAKSTDSLTLGLISAPLTNEYVDVLQRHLEENSLIFKSLACSPVAAMLAEGDALAKRLTIKKEDLCNTPVVCERDPVLLNALDDFIKEDQVLTISSNQDILRSQIAEWHAVDLVPQIARFSSKVSSSFVIVPFGEDAYFETCFGIIGTKEAFEDSRTKLIVERALKSLHAMTLNDETGSINLCDSCTVSHAWTEHPPVV